ncbi:LysR family transcriptional regulator [Collimonas sp.]|jgi:DNA-binding transcriptional LysR family regulator|uniref:LysR family transcriptional regulator n=1 Tax=Collimonas sp. TaxID=1963772 RepID=UPI002B8FD0AC|nr:LysR family transcriptional regulator [Collimonas sp.]HWW06276.1 LysR family transcriptional regulator [Collimonas sp.]
MPNLRKKLPSANALFVFEAAARCGNFTKAAAELYVTQPAVSRMLSRMEEHIGVQLFERVHGGITLTENGQILYRRVAEGFHGIETAIQEIEARRTGTETVTLSVSTAFTTHWLMPRMGKLHKEFPSVDLRFQLISGKIGGPVDDVDLGMRFVTGEESNYQGAMVMPEILLPICSQHYLDQSAVRQAEHEGDVLINLSDGERDWQRHFPGLQKRGRHSVSALNFSDYAIVIQAALLGQGIALGWVNVTNHWMRSGHLVPAVEEVFVTGRTCHLLHSPDKVLRPAAAEIRDWIIEETRADLAAVDALYPALQLAKLAHLSTSGKR